MYPKKRPGEEGMWVVLGEDKLGNGPPGKPQREQQDGGHHKSVSKAKEDNIATNVGLPDPLAKSGGNRESKSEPQMQLVVRQQDVNVKQETVKDILGKCPTENPVIHMTVVVKVSISLNALTAK